LFWQHLGVNRLEIGRLTLRFFDHYADAFDAQIAEQEREAAASHTTREQRRARTSRQ
jgi:hypothetical protein